MGANLFFEAGLPSVVCLPLFLAGCRSMPVSMSVRSMSRRSGSRFGVFGDGAVRRLRNAGCRLPDGTWVDTAELADCMGL